MLRWFITGVSSGIGEALATTVLARGDKVVGTARRADGIAALEALAPGHALGLHLDLDRLDAIHQVAQRALTAFGGIDIVVNNAGRSLFGAVEEATVEEVQAIMTTNFLAPLRIVQEFLPHFRTRGSGTFVNLSSGCGLFGIPGLGFYCASKFALEGLSETLAAETAGFGIRTMIVEPASVGARFTAEGTLELQKRLPEYDALTGRGKIVLQQYGDGERLLSQDVAEEIVKALDQPTVPLHLIVGSKMKAILSAKCDAMVSVR